MLPLTSILLNIFEIVSLHSNIRQECKKYVDDEIEEGYLIQVTQEMKRQLLRKTQELFEKIQMICNSNGKPIEGCLNLAEKIKNQANRIFNAFTPLNIHESLRGLDEIDFNVSILASGLSIHYDEIATKWERVRLSEDCHKKAVSSILKYPIPFFEAEIDEYNEIVEEVKIEYVDSRDRRAILNRKMLQFPGIVPFLMSLRDSEKRNLILNLIHRYNDSDPSAINPIPEEIMILLPCIKFLDFLDFSSEEEFRSEFIRFFKDGNWLETYVFLMLDRAGYSGRLLNVNLFFEMDLFEMDVLLLVKNRFFLFETKDRGASNGLTDNDLSEIEVQLYKIAKIKNIKIIYIINSEDEYQDIIRSQIAERSSSRGVNAEVLFLDNEGIDNLIGKIRMSLR